MFNSTPTVDDRRPEWLEIASIPPSNTIYAAAFSSVRPAVGSLGFCRAARTPFCCTGFVGRVGWGSRMDWIVTPLPQRNVDHAGRPISFGGAPVKHQKVIDSG